MISACEGIYLIRGLELSAHPTPPPGRGGRSLGSHTSPGGWRLSQSYGQWCQQSHLLKMPIKPSKKRGFRGLTLYISSIWLILSYIHLQSQNLVSDMFFLSSASHSSKLIKLREGVMGTSTYNPLIRSISKNLHLHLASEGEQEVREWALTQGDLMLSSGR